MTSQQHTFVELLKSRQQSITRARLAVFDALVGQEPLSMHELVQRVPAVDRASVYRAVDLFERLGIAQRLNTGWKYKLELTDKFSDHHHHLTCLQCGRTQAMNEGDLEEVLAKIAVSHNFTPTAHQIELQGICAACTKQAA